MLTKQERQSLKTARRHLHDVYIRLNCIARDHPEYASLKELAEQLIAEIAEVEKRR